MSSQDGEPAPLDAQSRLALAAALGDTPESVVAVHVLNRGLARAYVVGEPARFEAAIIRNLAFSSDELTTYGTNPEAAWAVLRALDGWSCVEVDKAIAPAVGAFVDALAGGSARCHDDIYLAAERPVPRIRHEAVRLLTPADAALLERAPSDVRGAGFRSAGELLVEGVAAAAIVDGRIVAIAHTAARSVRHVDIGVATLPAWRGQGLATAAAALVAERVQTAGRVPVWSTGEHNRASRRVAAKLGFREVSRRAYVIRPSRSSLAVGLTTDPAHGRYFTEGSMVRSTLAPAVGAGEPVK